MNIKFRDLRADEIEVRIQQIQPPHVTLLLYKNARCDMNILDETVGPGNWQREHYECKGNLFCRVGISCGMQIDGDGDTIVPSWVWKSDCGTESNTEAQKGEASDSFKRACVNWGIGRELYTSPTIRISSSDVNLKDTGAEDRYGRKIYKTWDNFAVDCVEIKDKKIIGLVIRNQSKGKVVFQYKESENPNTSGKQTPNGASCEDCKTPIVDSLRKDGTPWSSYEIREYSIKRFGVGLCPACMRAREDAAKKAAKAEKDEATNN